MIRSLCLSAALILPTVATAQFGERPKVLDAPRSIAGFDQWMGYEDLAAERFGTPDSPALHELGAFLLTRMFRNVCLGVERGHSLDDVMPPGFALVESSVHLMGTEPTGRGPVVLSVTGDIEKDEDGGHPWIYLSDGPHGMTCNLEWQAAAPIPSDRHENIADMLDTYFPFQMALVPADRPMPRAAAGVRNFTEWDRACADKWCPTTVNYNLERGSIMLNTVLNITSVGGNQP